MSIQTQISFNVPENQVVTLPPTSPVQAINRKYQKYVNRLVLIDAKYRALVNAGDVADGEGDEKLEAKIRTKQSNMYDKGCNVWEELTQREKNNLIKNDIQFMD